MTFPRPALAAVLVLALLAPFAPSRAEDASTTETDVDQLPEVLAECEPVMPDRAREARVEGTVLVEVLVGIDGWASDTRIARSIPLLDAAAERCANQYKFEPARHRGRRVEVWLTLPITFRLPPEPPSWQPAPKPRRPSETMKADSAEATRTVVPPPKPELPKLPPVPVPAPGAAPDVEDEEIAGDGPPEKPKQRPEESNAEADEDATETAADETEDAEAESAPVDDSETDTSEVKRAGDPAPEAEGALTEDDAAERAPASPKIEVRVTPAPDLDLQRAIAALRRAPRRPPSLDEAIVREDVIRRMRASGMPTQPDAAGEDQLARLAATLTADADRDSLRDAAAALLELTREWPAWATPYRELARTLELLDSPARAAICLELYLVAAPDAPDWRHVRQWLSRLRAEASQSQ